MSIFDAVASLFQSEKQTEEQRLKEDALRAAFKARCGHFKSLLSANKRALETMAGLEEALRGEHLFAMSFVRASCTTILANVFNMVRSLNELSGNKYEELYARLRGIQQDISAVIAPVAHDPDAPMVLALHKTGFSLAHEVGAKMASLGEAWQQLGQSIPDGFVVTASGYRRFLAENGLQEEINRRIQMADLTELDAVFGLSSSLQQLIISAPLPGDLEEDILSHYRVLEEKYGNVRLAVRSSAIGEDSLGSSFAGQYRSELNISGDTLLETYKEVVASKYSVTAMSYRVNRGIPDHEVPMCVGCLCMVDAVAGGVAYSADPMRSDPMVVINAVPGLPKGVVDGSSEVDVFRVSRQIPHAILEREVAQKTASLECAPEEGLVCRLLSPEESVQPCLTDGQILEVTKLALGSEVFYGRPQDLEWAFDVNGALILLQSRALAGAGARTPVLPPPKNAVLLLEGGVSAAPGVAAGLAVVVRRDADMLRFPKGAVLVVEQAHARWAPVLGRAAAVISASGGAAGHLASVAREYGLPALFGVKDALSLTEPVEVTVDADSCRVYQGRVEELLSQKRPMESMLKDSPLHKVLAQASELIVPLHLLDPELPEFAPEFCRTLHDITRFCHEKAVEEMFRVEESLFSGRFGKQLKYQGGKLQYFVVNIEDGFCEPVEGKYVEMEQICCAPMHALWEGMLAVTWHGPSSSARGLLAVVAESASNPELEITSGSMRLTRNYFLVDRNFCNLQASFGYHFCTVETQAGEQEQENYVSFHFKGGAANLGRRRTRVRVLADVLEENGFIADVKEDALSARAEAISQKKALTLLRILGFLLIHTRQMDAAMQGAESVSNFSDSLKRGIAQTLALYPEKA